MNKQGRDCHINLQDSKKIVDKSFTKKNHLYYLEQFLGSEKEFDKQANIIKFKGEKAVPKNVKENCRFCKGEGTDISDDTCAKYILQMEMSFFVAVSEFVTLILKNKLIYNDKPNLKKLTLQFLDCLYFIENEGLLFFDFDKIWRYTLNSGLLTITEILSNYEPLQAFKIANEALNGISDTELRNRLLLKKDKSFLKLQKEFLEDRKQYYYNKYLIEKDKGNIKKESNNKRPNRTDIAYYCYYANETKTLNINNIFPSDKAWTEIGELFDKNSKNIQSMYNDIVRDRSYRLKSSKRNNIKYVINNMLDNNERAKKLAKDELKIA